MAKPKEVNNESKIKKIDFLKVIGSNPDKKVGDICKDFGMSQSSAYNAINEFVLHNIWSDEDKDYPARVLNHYNKDVPNPDEQLTKTDIEQLRHYVDDYYEKHLPGGNMSKQAQEVEEVQDVPQIQEPPIEQSYRQETYNNPPQESYSRMSYPPQQPFNQAQYQKTDMTTDAGFLRSLLYTAKYVHPSIIDRLMQNYEMNKEIYDRDPLALLEVMKHMLTSQQGEVMWKIFQRGRGKFVTDSMGNLHPNQAGQMDPNLMMMFMNMMQGNGGNPQQMMPMMMGMGSPGGGAPGYGMDPQQMMMWMMMNQMGQKTQRDQAKQDQQDQMDKLIQVIMLKMVGSATEDKKPWDMMMGMGPYGGMMGPPQVQEVLDPSSGRVTQRNIVPNFGGQAQGSGHDSILTAVLNNTMNTNTQLLMKLTDVGKTPTDILMSMIPYFKDSGNASLQLTNMIKTMNEIAPGFFSKQGNQEGPNIEIAKLKFDTDLAIQAQRMELSKMEHAWRIDEMDRKANNDNASNWMHMIEGLGGSFSDKIAPALLEGLGKGSLMGGKGGQGPPPMDPMQQQMRMRQMQMQQMREAQREEREAKMEQEAEMAERKEQQNYQNQIQSEQQQAAYMIMQLQGALQQRDAQIQHLSNQIRDYQSVPTRAYQGGGNPNNAQISDQQLVRLSTGELQSMLHELKAQNAMESSIAGRIESILSNRQLMDQQQPPMSQQPQQQSVPEPTDMNETEEVSSQETKGMEEKFD